MNQGLPTVDPEQELRRLLADAQERAQAAERSWLMVRDREGSKSEPNRWDWGYAAGMVQMAAANAAAIKALRADVERLFPNTPTK